MASLKMSLKTEWSVCHKGVVRSVRFSCFSSFPTTLSLPTFLLPWDFTLPMKWYHVKLCFPRELHEDNFCCALDTPLPSQGHWPSNFPFVIINFFSLFWIFKIRIQTSVISLILKIKIGMPSGCHVFLHLLHFLPLFYFPFFYFSNHNTLGTVVSNSSTPVLSWTHSLQASDPTSFLKFLLLWISVIFMFPNLAVTSQSYFCLTYQQHLTVHQSCPLITFPPLGFQDIFWIFFLLQRLFLLPWVVLPHCPSLLTLESPNVFSSLSILSLYEHCLIPGL